VKASAPSQRIFCYAILPRRVHPQDQIELMPLMGNAHYNGMHIGFEVPLVLIGLFHNLFDIIA
jgi:hypothetical protein